MRWTVKCVFGSRSKGDAAVPDFLSFFVSNSTLYRPRTVCEVFWKDGLGGLLCAEARLGALESGAALLVLASCAALLGLAALLDVLGALLLALGLRCLDLLNAVLPATRPSREWGSLEFWGGGSVGGKMSGWSKAENRDCGRGSERAKQNRSGRDDTTDHSCLLFCLRFSSRLIDLRSSVGSSLTFWPSARASDACHAMFSSIAAAWKPALHHRHRVSFWSQSG